MTDQAQKEFDTWWDRQPFHTQFEDLKQQMFNVWVASRAELEVQIELDEWPTSIARDIRGAIEAAGLKVAP